MNKPDYDAILKYMVEHPAILPADVAARFNVGIWTVYNLRKKPEFQSQKQGQAHVTNHMTKEARKHCKSCKELLGGLLYGIKSTDKFDE